LTINDLWKSALLKRDKCTESQYGESPFAFNKALGSFGISDVS
jgi:hypothetical protein